MAVDIFSKSEPLERIAEPRQGMATSDVGRFIRFWFEVDYSSIGFGCACNDGSVKSNRKWFPHNKGGEFRRWYGNNLSIVNWRNGGQDVLAYAAELYGSPTRTVKNIAYYFKPSVSWSLIGSGAFSARVNSEGFTFDVAGPSAFPEKDSIPVVAGFLNSEVASYFMKAINPTMNFNSGDIARLPFLIPLGWKDNVSPLIGLSKEDWDSFEISWDFMAFTLVRRGGECASI